MKNLKLKFAHFSILAAIALSLFTASCEDVEINITCADLDYIALRALYLSTDGDNWTDNTGWMTAAEFEANPDMPADTDLSTWNGVTTDANGCVTELVLANNLLFGNIPPQVGLLLNLESLLLFNNALEGDIPTELGNLSNLEILSLDNNITLSGSIPAEFGNLSNLVSLSLSSNGLNSSIPAELGNLSNLVILNLNGNELSGNIPAELGNLSNLQSLSLYSNQLSGCYDSNLSNLCSPSMIGNLITSGNNFDASWDSFCATGAGTCGQ